MILRAPTLRLDFWQAWFQCLSDSNEWVTFNLVWCGQMFGCRMRRMGMLLLLLEMMLDQLQGLRTVYPIHCIRFYCKLSWAPGRNQT